MKSLQIKKISRLQWSELSNKIIQKISRSETAAMKNLPLFLVVYIAMSQNLY